MAKTKRPKKVETFNTELRDRYTVDKKVRTASGGYSVSNQDDVAKALNGLSVEQLEKVAARAGLAERFKKWAHLNPGMQRMNLGNVARAATDKKKVGAALAEARKMPRPGTPEKAKPARRKKAAEAPAPVS